MKKLVLCLAGLLPLAGCDRDLTIEVNPEYHGQVHLYCATTPEVSTSVVVPETGTATFGCPREPETPTIVQNGKEIFDSNPHWDTAGGMVIGLEFTLPDDRAHTSDSATIAHLLHPLTGSEADQTTRP